MNFKNDLEERCFQIAQGVFGHAVQLEHNKRLEIENSLFPEVAAFKGPPAKEVDVLVITFSDKRNVKLLVSCKELTKRAEPAHVQEWAAVVRTMNAYSDGTLYLGLVVSSNGFTNGCEAWATSHNLAIIPPLKGKNIRFSRDTVLSMFSRALKAFEKRLRLNSKDLETAPAFFDFIFSLVSDFEGHDDRTKDSRYLISPAGWVSSFEEMYSRLAGRLIQELIVYVDGSTMLKFSDGAACRFTESQIEFGEAVKEGGSVNNAAICRKNLENEPCTLEFVTSKAIGLPVTSAADFGDYIEFGVDRRFNLAMHSEGFRLIWTENPPSAHRL